MAHLPGWWRGSDTGSRLWCPLLGRLTSVCRQNGALVSLQHSGGAVLSSHPLSGDGPGGGGDGDCIVVPPHIGGVSHGSSVFGSCPLRRRSHDNLLASGSLRKVYSVFSTVFLLLLLLVVAVGCPAAGFG